MARLPVLDTRALGRATLARQMLLAREDLPVLKALARLGPLQAQLPRPPFLALHARLRGFERSQLLSLLRERKVVRGTLMRGTLHLVGAREYLRWRPALAQALLEAGRALLESRSKGKDLAMDPVAVAAAAAPLFEEKARSFEDVRRLLQKRFPKADPRALGYAARMGLGLLQVPGEGPWGFASIADFISAQTWLGAKLPADSRPDAAVLLYLEAFGPATVADAQGFLGLGGLQPAFDRLRPRLRTFQDEKGRELFDLEDAPRPPGDTSAPPRFLPDFDSLVLAHADRSRLVADEDRKRLATKNLRIPPTVLVDGRLAGTWETGVKRGTATLLVRPFGRLGRKEQAGLVEEGEALLRFTEPEARAFAVQFAK